MYGCAADRQQASIVFEKAADMVRMCPALSKRVSVHGFNIYGVVFDELHIQPNRKLFDVMTKGSGDAKTQLMYFLITTAGTDTNSICCETHQKSKDIIEGRKNAPTFYSII